MKYDITLSGSFITKTPLTYTAPDYEKTISSFPLMGGKPYFPATAIRGRLRRCARDVLLEATGQKLDFDDLFALTLGGIKGGKEKKVKQSFAIEVMRTAEKFNPLISLFGAMSPTAIPSKLAVNHAITHELKERVLTTVRLSRTNDVTRNPSRTAEIVTNDFEETYQTYTDTTREKSKIKSEQIDLKRSLKNATDEERAKIKAELADLKKQEQEIDEVSINQVLSYDVIQPGTSLDVGMRLSGVTEDEISLFLKSLDAFAFNPVMGGRVAQGNGVISGRLVVAAREAGAKERHTEIGSVSWQGEFEGIDVDGPRLKEWQDRPLPIEQMNLSLNILLAAAKGEK